MAEEKIILEFEIDAKEALDTLAKAREQLVLLRKEQSELQKSIKNGTAGEDAKKRFAEIGVEIKNLNGVIRANTNELDNQVKAYKAAEGSLEQIRAELKNVKSEYEALSAAEREGARGQELIDKMNKLNLSAKEVQAQMSGVPIGLSKAVAAMKQMGPFAGNAAAGVSKLGLAFKALLANPIVLAIAAIVAVIKKLVDSFKKNDEAMTKLQKAFAPFKAVLSVIERAFQAIVNVIAKVIEWYGKLYSKIISIIPGMKDYVQAQEDIVESTDKLEDKEREYTVNSAKRNAEISELRNKSLESEKYTVEERRKFLEDALKLEKEDADEKREIAAEKLRIAQKQALGEIGYTEMTEEAWNKLSDEQKNTLSQLQADVINTTTEFNNSIRRMTSQLNSFDKEVKRQEEERQKQQEEDRKKAAENYKQRVELERTALQELEDLTIESMKDLQVKEEKQAQVQTQREIDAIKEKLKTETNLSETARKAMNQKIVLLETNLQLKLGEISKKYNEERLKSQLELTQKYYEEALKTATGEKAIAYQQILSNMVFDSQIKALEDRKKYLFDIIDDVSDKEAMEIAKESQQIDAIIDSLRKNKSLAATKIEVEGQNAIDAIKSANEQLIQEISDNKLLGKFYDNEVEKTKIFEQQARNRLAIAEAEYNRLKNYSEEEQKAVYGSFENYQNVLLTAENNVVKSQNDVANAIRNTNEVMKQQQLALIETFNSYVDSMNGLVGAFGNLFTTLAEDDADMQKFANAMAYTQIMMDMAQGISGAVAQAQSVPFPANIAAMITGMTAVTTAIGSAIALYKQNNKVATPPKFADGGLVGGVTSDRTDDSVSAKLSVGEFVMKSSSVKSLGVDTLNSMNTTGRIPQAQFSYDMLREIVVEAASSVKNEVSVQEITSLQRKVEVKENISKY